MADVVIVQSSLRTHSRTSAVALALHKTLLESEVSSEIIDLRDYTFPFCDGRALAEYFPEYPDVEIIYNKLNKAKLFVLAYPVYLYTISGVLKNFLDIVGGALKNKYFGIIANAGGRNGYMSSNDLIAFMLYDFNAHALMPQVYSAQDDFTFDGETYQLVGEKPLQKVEQLAQILKNKIESEIKLNC